MRSVAIALVLILAITAGEAAPGHTGHRWKEVREPTEPPAAVLTRGNLDCSGAIPIVVGQTIWSSNIGAPTNVDGYPECISWSEEGGEIVFELTLDGPANQDIGISLWYRPDLYDLDWFLLGSCDEDDCIEFDNYSWPIDDLAPGTYYLVVDGFLGDECDFVVAVYPNEPAEECSPLLSTCHKWDFNSSDEDFVHLVCGNSVLAWEWGAAPAGIPETACEDEPVVNVLSTGLSGSYPPYAADAVLVGPVLVGEDCSCLQICHYYSMCPNDGGMVGVTTDGGTTWSLLTPARGYDEIGEWDNSCIGPWPCLSEGGTGEFAVDSFDITPWIGSEVSIGFFFGADGTYAYEGWNILWAAIGTSESPVEHSSWGAIKALYR